VRTMKDLQKKLGKCQDLSVHRGVLEGIRETVAPDPAARAALGALLEALAHRRDAAVEDALRSFARIADRVDHDRNSTRNASGDCDQESRL